MDNRFKAGSMIQTWGDLAWVLENDTHIVVCGESAPVSSVQMMTWVGIQRLLLEGKLAVAVETPAPISSRSKK